MKDRHSANPIPSRDHNSYRTYTGTWRHHLKPRSHAQILLEPGIAGNYLPKALHYGIARRFLSPGANPLPHLTLRPLILSPILFVPNCLFAYAGRGARLFLNTTDYPAQMECCALSSLRIFAG